MHKATLLEGTIRLQISPDGPILIKAGERGGGDPTLPDMEFVRSRGQVYIPGSSLKGVVRAQCERICRSLDSADLQRKRQAVRQQLDSRGGEPLVPLADNPLGNGREYRGLDDMSYSSGRAIEAMRLDGPERSAQVYRRSSLVSQLFGHTSLAARVRFADAYHRPPPGQEGAEPAIEERNGVAIDRIYGSVAVGPFNFETVVDGNFQTRIDLKNLTLAQLGLLGLALRDLADGRIGIGFGKSRGLGRVAVDFQRLTLHYPTCRLGPDGALTPAHSGPSIAAGTLAGLGAIAGEQYAAYALPRPDTGALSIDYSRRDAAEDTLSAGVFGLDDELIGSKIVAVGKDAVFAVWRACMPAWKQEIGLE